MTDKFRYILAPIEDMTSNAFRTICHKYGADLTFTEMTRAEGLAKKNQSTWSRLVFHDNTPTEIQLLGAREMHIKKFLSMFEPHKGFEGFNLNFGCPSPHVVNQGQGCALVRRISKARKLVDAIKSYGYKVSIKMRLGMNQQDKEKKVYLNLIKAVKASYFILHARYGAQTYTEPADFKVYSDCVKTGKNIIANGDITTKEQVKVLKEQGLKGVMIGRAAIRDPGIFNRLKGITIPPKEEIIKEFISLSRSYEEPFKYVKNIEKHSKIKDMRKIREIN